MPIKINKNQGINIKQQLLSIMLSINVNSKKGFVFAQKISRATAIAHSL